LYRSHAGGVTDDALKSMESHGIKPRLVEPIEVLTDGGRWSTTFQKLSILSMTEYDKIVWIDADMMIVRNIDMLFNLPHMSCVRSRAPIPGTDLYPFNSGLMVVKPNKEEFYGTCSLINQVVMEYQKRNSPVGDQNVFNAYYSTWPYENEKHLPDGYNVFWGSIEDYISTGYSIYGNATLPIYVLHYTGSHKPWNRRSWFGIKSYIRALRYHRRLPSHDAKTALKEYRRYLEEINEQT